jgi:hypothetical protein
MYVFAAVEAAQSWETFYFYFSFPCRAPNSSGTVCVNCRLKRRNKSKKRQAGEFCKSQRNSEF